MTRKDDNGDQPSGGETTWTNTGATRYGRGLRKHAEAFTKPRAGHYGCLKMMMMNTFIVRMSPECIYSCRANLYLSECI